MASFVWRPALAAGTTPLVSTAARRSRFWVCSMGLGALRRKFRG